MLTEIQTIEGGQKDVILRWTNKKTKQKKQKLINKLVLVYEAKSSEHVLQLNFDWLNLSLDSYKLKYKNLFKKSK